MDFFARQDKARHLTGRLLIAFSLAVLLTVAAVYLLVVLIFLRPPNPQQATLATWLWQPQPLAIVCASTLGIIGIGSLYRIIELASGGRVVAQSLGGVRLPAEPRNESEKRLRNVVEEMAIAAGVSIPEIYILPDEQAINAFAAGYTPDDAVIGVTQGCLQQLTRDELQGVIAHEFSHILNGDMRLNIRLMGVLFGLLCLAMVGQILLRTRGRKNPLPLLGLGLIAIGGIGVLAGRLIQSAASRQREFLADAAAVQFTRNPDGLAGALKKIGGLLTGSKLHSARAPEASHLFFANGLTSSWSSLFATHPPLTDRIRAIDPTFEGRFTPTRSQPSSPQPATYSQLSPSPPPTATPPPLTAESWISSAGQLDPQLLQRAAAWRNALPPTVLQTLHTPQGATQTVFALLLSSDIHTLQAQIENISATYGPSFTEAIQTLAPHLASLPQGAKLPLTDLCLPALRELSPNDQTTFLLTTRVLIEADQEINLLEFAIQKSLQRHLHSQTSDARRPSIRHHSLQPVAPACEIILSVLSHLTSTHPQTAQQAFAAGSASINLPKNALRWRPQDSCGLGEVENAIQTLQEVAPLHKRNVLYASAKVIMADRKITPEEMELLRALADSLDCPIPPILPTT
ncbi:MAG: M48 family metallopeptidase [Limisphaerales bacterium]